MHKIGRVIVSCMIAFGALGYGLAGAATTPHVSWSAWALVAGPQFAAVEHDYNAVKAALDAGEGAKAEQAFQAYDVANVAFAGRDDSPGNQTNAAIAKFTADGNAWAWEGYLSLKNLKQADLAKWEKLQKTLIADSNTLGADLTAKR